MHVAPCYDVSRTRSVALLPQELVDHIIDFLHDDKKTLARCCLVNHMWLPSSRYHLFHSISLSIRNHKDRSPTHSASKTLKRFTNFVSKHLYARRLIRSLSISKGQGSFSVSIHSSHLVALVIALSRLQTLSLKSVYLLGADPKDGISLLFQTQSCLRLDELRFEYGIFAASEDALFGAPFIDFLSAFSHIDKLCFLGNASFRDRDTIAEIPDLPTKVKVATISAISFPLCFNGTINPYLLRTIDFASIRSLHTDMFTDLPSFAAYLRHPTLHLKHLHLNLRLRRSFLIPAFPNVGASLSQSGTAALEAFCVDVDGHDTCAKWDEFLELITTMLQRPLKRLELNMHLTYHVPLRRNAFAQNMALTSFRSLLERHRTLRRTIISFVTPEQGWEWEYTVRETLGYFKSEFAEMCERGRVVLNGSLLEDGHGPAKMHS
ncbi:unnamed protein product [Somion occarium]